MPAIDALAGQRQILQASAGILSVLWMVDGEAADPGVVTVGSTTIDGTVVLPPGTATDGSGVAARSVAYTSAHTAALDTLTLTWTSPNYGDFSVAVEVVGAWLFTIGECQAFDNAAVLGARPTIGVDAIEETRSRILDEFEGMTGVAWVPRYRRDVYNGDGTSELFTATGRVRSVRLAEQRGVGTTTWTAFTQDEQDDLIVERWGVVRRESGGVWPFGKQNVRIGYEHGEDTPPLDIKRAALMAARYELIPSGLTDRAMSIFTEAGSVQLWTPGVSGRGQAIHPLPEVDRILRAHSEKVPAIG